MDILLLQYKPLDIVLDIGLSLKGSAGTEVYSTLLFYLVNVQYVVVL